MLSILYYLLIPFLALNASFSPSYTQPECLVTEISISCTDIIPDSYHFTDQASMQKILQYLRSVEFLDGINDPPAMEASPIYEITLTHSTGRVTTYRQVSNQYLSKNNGRWHCIDPEQGRLLSELYIDLT